MRGVPWASIETCEGVRLCSRQRLKLRVRTPPSNCSLIVNLMFGLPVSITLSI